MIDSLPKYPKYRDSGLEWLGPIPEHWDLKPGLAAFAPKKVKNTGLRENTVLSLSYGRIVVKPQEKLHGLVPESFETYQIVDPGDIIIRGTDLQNDKQSLRIGLVRNRGIITSAYLCFRPRPQVSSEYAYQILNVYDLTKALYAYGSGLRQNLNNSDIKRLPVFLPPQDEQDAIIRFLHDFDRNVRRFIRNRQRLIEVLNEQKQAIINGAVTRGLDPNVKLKPSGIDWLGDIPEHWEVKRLRNVGTIRFSNIDKHSHSNELPVRLCNYTDVYKNEEITADLPFMKATVTPSELSMFRLRVGDVILTKDSEDWLDIGVPAVVASSADDLVCGYHLAILRPNENQTNGAFLSNALQSVSARAQLSLSAKGVTRYGLSQGAIRGLKLPVPPYEEQVVIAGHIRTETRALEAAISKARDEISLIREYRIRLIADVVTGKVDVRGIAVEQKKSAATVIQFPKEKKSGGPKANVHFRRSVFAAEIVSRLHAEPTFGHVKFEKLIFLCEKRCGVDIGSTYYRQAAGPYDSRALRSIDSQMEKQKWYAARKVQGRYQYVPLAKAGGHKTYFSRYFADIEEEFSNIIEMFRKLDTERCEIVVTLYSAWEDLLANDEEASEDSIVEQVLHHWHPSKQRIGKDRWYSAIGWMKEKGFVPKVTGVSHGSN